MGAPDQSPQQNPEALRVTREFLAEHVAPLVASAGRGEGGVLVSQSLARAYDALLHTHFSAAEARWRASGGCARVALIALGGYGRGLLAPGSDLDLALLTDAREPGAVDALAEQVLYPLWDAGVMVGHAVRSSDELASLARADLPSATALLDARLLAGDAELAREALSSARRAAVDGDLDGFIDRLRAEMAARHGRFGGSVYLLEPEVKHGRGGLRDMDIARWALSARWRARDFTEALHVGALGDAEHARLNEAKAFAWRLRGAMHRRAGRRADRLTFDEQEECAARLGFIDGAARSVDPDGAVAQGASRLMSQWYRHARDVATLVDQVLDLARSSRGRVPHAPRLERVAPELSRFEGTVCLAHTDSLRRDPLAALRLIEQALSLELPIATSSRASVLAASRDPGWCASLREAQGAGAAFLRLLTHRATAATRGVRAISSTGTNEFSVLAEVHDLGLLLAMIPEFEAVTARVQHDVYHVYTVDVHSVAAVDHLHAIARGELVDAHPLAGDVLARVDRRELLCLATLLHDVGKAHGRHHARVGAAMAGPIALRLGLGEDDAETVAWLVNEHLTLYHLATRRDLGDAATVARVAEVFRDGWRLDALYLLTVADLSTTSPTAMTTWKARLLDELYLRAHPSVRDRPGVEVDRVEALAAQALMGVSGEERAALEALLRRMPARYLLATHPEAVRRHARRLSGLGPGERRIFVDPLSGDASGTLVEVLVACPDRPGLLSLLAALLLAQRLDVHHAEIHTRDGAAVDVFAARAPSGSLLDPRRIEAALLAQLDALLDGALSPETLVGMSTAGRWTRAEPQVQQKVRVHSDASATATVLEVFGRDRPGFLYAVTRALHDLGLEIHLAKVNTEGRRVADVFYVSERDGSKLTEARGEAAREALLAALG